MIRVVLDASVCLKWFLHERIEEEDVSIALDLHREIAAGRQRLVQPALWRVEVGAVLARLLPTQAPRLVAHLTQIDVDIEDGDLTHVHAVELAISLRHHLFDTIYHAIALQRDITLITADEHYYRKARKLGNVVLLRDWPPRPGIAEARANYRPRARHAPGRARKKR